MINLPKGNSRNKGPGQFYRSDDEHVLMIYPKSEEQEIKGVSREMVLKFGGQYS